MLRGSVAARDHNFRFANLSLSLALPRHDPSCCLNTQTLPFEQGSAACCCPQRELSLIVVDILDGDNFGEEVGVYR
jgi:hypothetical protein